MQSEKRLSYLENQWEKYPAIKVPVLSVQELKADFAKLTSGGRSRAAEFYFAGRIHLIVKSPLSHEIEQLSIQADGEEFFLKLEKLNGLADYRELVQDVLAPGDQILLKISWMDVMTSGLFPKIESMTPSELTLLAPARVPYVPSHISHKRAKQWDLFLTLVRQCFEFLQFNEVRTPTLTESPGLETYLEPFKAEFQMGEVKKTFFLPTSPEFGLKKILSHGHSRIFEIKECFRNGELSPHHQPEFMMLEWYRSYANIEQIIKDVRGLLNYLKLHWPEPLRGWGPLQEKTMAQLFEAHCGFQLTPTTTLQELRALSERLGVTLSASDDWDEAFFKIFLEKIEPHLGVTGPFVVRDYPPSQCAWARINAQGWADRFEVYWRGVELANAYHELNDPIEQRRRFEESNEKRKARGGEALPLDIELLKALEAGFPPAAGIALGLDRLFMLIVDARELEETRFFPIRHPHQEEAGYRPLY